LKYTTLEHRKIIIDVSTLGRNTHADYYWAGEESSNNLVVFIGGSINEQEYAQRMNSSPDKLAEIFKCAIGNANINCDFIALSSPPSGKHTHDNFLNAFMMFLLQELLPKTRSPRPRNISIAGNSYGAYVATFLAMSLAPVKALVTFAGAGMTEAAIASNRININSLKIKVFSNIDDGTEEEDRRFSEYLKRNSVNIDVVRRNGGHSFCDYISNGSVDDGINYLLENLR